MAKKKSKLKNIQVTLKSETKFNPFDFHFNKVKRNVLGRKTTKSEFGRPTHSRHKEHDKRKQTLFKEYLNRDKTGKGLLDQRLKVKYGVCARKAKLYTSFDVDKGAIDLTHKGLSLNSIKLNEAVEGSFNIFFFVIRFYLFFKLYS